MRDSRARSSSVEVKAAMGRGGIAPLIMRWALTVKRPKEIAPKSLNGTPGLEYIVR